MLFTLSITKPQIKIQVQMNLHKPKVSRQKNFTSDLRALSGEKFKIRMSQEFSLSGKEY